MADLPPMPFGAGLAAEAGTSGEAAATTRSSGAPLAGATRAPGGGSSTRLRGGGGGSVPAPAVTASKPLAQSKADVETAKLASALARAKRDFMDRQQALIDAQAEVDKANTQLDALLAEQLLVRKQHDSLAATVAGGEGGLAGTAALTSAQDKLARLGSKLSAARGALDAAMRRVDATEAGVVDAEADMSQLKAALEGQLTAEAAAAAVAGTFEVAEARVAAEVTRARRTVSDAAAAAAAALESAASEQAALQTKLGATAAALEAFADRRAAVSGLARTMDAAFQAVQRRKFEERAEAVVGLKSKYDEVGADIRAEARRRAAVAARKAQEEAAQHEALLGAGLNPYQVHRQAARDAVVEAAIARGRYEVAEGELATTAAIAKEALTRATRYERAKDEAEALDDYYRTHHAPAVVQAKETAYMLAATVAGTEVLDPSGTNTGRAAASPSRLTSLRPSHFGQGRARPDVVAREAARPRNAGVLPMPWMVPRVAPHPDGGAVPPEIPPEVLRRVGDRRRPWLDAAGDEGEEDDDEEGEDGEEGGEGAPRGRRGSAPSPASITSGAAGRGGRRSSLVGGSPAGTTARRASVVGASASPAGDVLAASPAAGRPGRRRSSVASADGKDDEEEEQLPQSEEEEDGMGPDSPRFIGPDGTRRYLPWRQLTVMESQMMADARQRQRDNVTGTQVVMGKEYHGPGFLCDPEVIHFKDFDVGVPMTLKISLTNVSLSFNAFRLLPIPDPFRDLFDIEFTQPGRVVAGRTTPLTITFTARQNKDINTHLPVLAKTGLIQVPLRASTKKALPVVEPADLDLGAVELGEAARGGVVIRNEGALPVKIRVSGPTAEDGSYRVVAPPPDRSTPLLQAVTRPDPLPPLFSYPFDLELPGYGSVVWPVTFKPYAVGKAVLTTRFAFDNPLCDPVDVVVRGRGLPSPLYVEDDTLQLLTCVTGKLYRVTLTVRNRGTTTMRCTAMLPEGLREPPAPELDRFGLPIATESKGDDEEDDGGMGEGADGGLSSDGSGDSGSDAEPSKRSTPEGQPSRRGGLRPGEADPGALNKPLAGGPTISDVLAAHRAAVADAEQREAAGQPPAVPRNVRGQPCRWCVEVLPQVAYVPGRDTHTGIDGSATFTLVFRPTSAIAKWPGMVPFKALGKRPEGWAGDAEEDAASLYQRLIAGGGASGGTAAAGSSAPAGQEADAAAVTRAGPPPASKNALVGDVYYDHTAFPYARDLPCLLPRSLPPEVPHSYVVRIPLRLVGSDQILPVPVSLTARVTPGHLTITPKAGLSFGDVPVGVPVVRHVTVTNNTALPVQAMVLAPPLGLALDATTTRGLLALLPGESRSLGVTLCAPWEGPYAKALTIRTTHGRTYKARMTATGHLPQLVATPATVVMAPLAPGQQEELPLVLRNVTAPLRKAATPDPTADPALEPGPPPSPVLFQVLGVVDAETGAPAPASLTVAPLVGRVGATGSAELVLRYRPTLADLPPAAEAPETAALEDAAEEQVVAAPAAHHRHWLVRIATMRDEPDAATAPRALALLEAATGGRRRSYHGGEESGRDEGEHLHAPTTPTCQSLCVIGVQTTLLPLGLAVSIMPEGDDGEVPPAAEGKDDNADALTSIGGPLVLDFGVVPIGQKATRRLRVVNKSIYPQHLRSVLPAGPFAVPTAPAVLQPGEAAVLAVEFYPLAQKRYGLPLSVSGADRTATVSVSLRGIGVPPRIALDPAGPARIDFGRVVAGDHVTEPVTVVNHSPFPVRISVLRTDYPSSLQACESAPTFWVEPPEATLPAGGSAALVVNYAPRALTGPAQPHTALFAVHAPQQDEASRLANQIIVSGACVDRSYYLVPGALDPAPLEDGLHSGLDEPGSGPLAQRGSIVALERPDAATAMVATLPPALAALIAEADGDVATGLSLTAADGGGGASGAAAAAAAAAALEPVFVLTFPDPPEAPAGAGGAAPAPAAAAAKPGGKPPASAGKGGPGGGAGGSGGGGPFSSASLVLHCLQRRGPHAGPFGPDGILGGAGGAAAAAPAAAAGKAAAAPAGKGGKPAPPGSAGASSSSGAGAGAGAATTAGSAGPPLPSPPVSFKLVLPPSTASGGAPPASSDPTLPPCPHYFSVDPTTAGGGAGSVSPGSADSLVFRFTPPQPPAELRVSADELRRGVVTTGYWSTVTALVVLNGGHVVAGASSERVVPIQLRAFVRVC